MIGPNEFDDCVSSWFFIWQRNFLECKSKYVHCSADQCTMAEKFSETSNASDHNYGNIQYTYTDLLLFHSFICIRIFRFIFECWVKWLSTAYVYTRLIADDSFVRIKEKDEQKIKNAKSKKWNANSSFNRKKHSCLFTRSIKKCIRCPKCFVNHAQLYWILQKKKFATHKIWQYLHWINRFLIT